MSEPPTPESKPSENLDTPSSDDAVDSAADDVEANAFDAPAMDDGGGDVLAVDDLEAAFSEIAGDGDQGSQTDEPEKGSDQDASSVSPGETGDPEEDDLESAFAEIATGSNKPSEDADAPEHAAPLAGGEGLVDAADLEAALDEASHADANIPDLDDGSGAKEGDATDATAPAQAPPGKPAKSGESKRKLRFKIGKDAKIAPPPPEGLDALDTPEARASAVEAIPTPPALKRAFRLLDAALDVADRPVQKLDKSRRNLIGVVALTTAIISVAAMLLLPLLIPRQTPITFLRERYDRMIADRAAQAKPPATPAPTTD
ncbi:MAG: hypothetical protein D6744_14365 [Planctomycetota bacterium]|nr:MAG: hypothetical protein D6744_14365 [Planctomycetota bacterium]